MKWCLLYLCLENIAFYLRWSYLPTHSFDAINEHVFMYYYGNVEINQCPPINVILRVFTKLVITIA